MFAEQRRRRLGHPLQVQGAALPGDKVASQSGTRRAVQDEVAVNPAGGGITGMEIRRDGFRPGQANIRRQMAVGAKHPGVIVSPGLRFKMRHLVQRMDAGVGPARAICHDGVVRHLRQGPFDGLLHGRGMILLLPA